MNNVTEFECLSDNRRPIGLLAGSGQFPIHFARRARELGLPVVCLGIRHEASEELKALTNRFHWVGLAKLGRMIRCFKREGVRRIVMAGKVHKIAMHKPARFLHYLPDLRFLVFWFMRRRRNNSDDSILLGVIEEFARDGMDFVSALEICPELLVKTGTLTKRHPTAKELADIRYGWHLAKEMGRLDVGQSVSVKERAVIAVEAIEGTDRAILRSGELCPAGGFVVVKVAKPQQDMRFDVPTIGPNTVENMRQAGGRVLAIESQKTIIIDQERTIQSADQSGITIVAVDAAEVAEPALATG